MKFLAFVFLCFLGVTSIAAPDGTLSLNPANKKTIQWMIHELPPFIYTSSNDAILNSENLHGPLGGLYKVLASSMPGYDHRFVRIPLLRAMKVIRENKQICSLVLAENKERRNFLYFGEEITAGLPFGLITLQSLAPSKYVSVNAVPNEIIMEQTLEKKQFRLGFVNGRYYPQALTPLLEKSTKSYGFHGDGSIDKLFSMLQAKRIDGVLGVYLEMAEFEKNHPGEKMQFFRIKEAPEFTALRASCERTPWGKRAVKEISKLIREKNFKELSHEYLMAHLPPERRKEYQKIYETRPPTITEDF
ncbi:hypothetical protein AZI86_17705 [Bdellovibrio bacteriovorus]|uniref:Solute-binding protein family 3/N-terminal domain-containing protein n=1 Tax=Bdellovibrio bacteriovorus TaxID=959 RepID=A0A150WF36_BDEBC|nr:TIGR02285 family protein [Bdellovibrio bacteriovorus]KYG61543.1 hypothetical protein AZI86_17705 [Bdellovibrio bacteriovorus]